MCPLQKLKPLGFVIEIGLSRFYRDFVSETASQCFGMPSPSLGTQPADVLFQQLLEGVIFLKKFACL